MVERVAIRTWAARALVDEYRSSAGRVAGVANDLRSSILQACDLLDCAGPAVAADLEALAIELAGDGDDLAWRVDLITGFDAARDFRGRRIAELPKNRPPSPARSAIELAAVFATLLDSGVRLSNRERAILDDGLAEYARHDATEHWGEVVDFWGDELVESDARLGNQLLDIADDLTRRGFTLAELAPFFEELSLQQHDPAYMATFFTNLGPERTAMVPVMLADAAYGEALSARRDVDFTFDPVELRDTFASSLAVASHAVTFDRYAQPHSVLGWGWFDDLFDQATWTDNNWFGDDPVYVVDTFPTLFAAGEFRPGVARRAGELGLEVFDHQVRVDRGVGSPLYAGFDELETHWEDRGGFLTGAAARVPAAAAAVLTHETTSGRTGAEIVADRSYDNMDRAVVAPHYAELILAGTVLAEERALVDGVDIRALRDPLHAKAYLIEAIAEQVRADTEEQPYPALVNNAMSRMVVQTTPHFVRASDRLSSTVSVDLDGSPGEYPSDNANLFVAPEYLNYLFGGLFRHETDRRTITAKLIEAQRAAYANAPDSSTLVLIGRTDGALVSGFNIAGIDDAEAQAREIEAANNLVDSIYNGTEVLIGVVPNPVVKAFDTAVATVDGGLEVVGVNPLEDFVHGDTETVVNEAHMDATSGLFTIQPRAERFVFDRAFEQMQAEYRLGGSDGLSETSRAIFEHMSTEPALAEVFVPGVSRVADFTPSVATAPNYAPTEAENEYRSAAFELILDNDVLKEERRDYLSGSQSAWPGESNEDGGT